jgi:hypothetical protein
MRHTYMMGLGNKMKLSNRAWLLSCGREVQKEKTVGIVRGRREARG